MRSFRATPWLAATLAVGVILGGLLVGYEPAGGDPDTMYRPIKSELARALYAGRLPFWSDRFGLGVPLLAESHAAAFYPLNLVSYRLLHVPVAYRLAMWLHFVALAGATYGYARCLGITPWGSALAALAFALCGFQTIHNCHEPFYHALPYLPLALILTETYVARGGALWVVLLALTWGVQLTLGHFQIQMWTGGLVLVTGLWRVWADRRPWWRGVGLVSALAWGAAMCAVQLALTWELSRVAGFDRPYHFLSNYSFPPAHWAQVALPRLFMGLSGGPEDSYWGQQQTTGGEACFYVGTVPLICALIGLVAQRRDRALAPWKWIALLSFLLAALPRLWPDGFLALLHLPGLGYFRAPARYTLLTSLGLSLLAGRGFDRAVSSRRYLGGLMLAVLFALAAAAWGYHWTHLRPDLHRSLGGDAGLYHRLGESAIAWVVSLVAVVLWRSNRIGAWGPLLVAAIELGFLFYQGPTEWGWPRPLPESSPVLSRLGQEPGVGLVAGRLENIPVRAGLTPAFPYLGITPPPPNYLLEATKTYEKTLEPETARWMRRFGVTHGVWEGPPSAGSEPTMYVGPDQALDRLVPRGHAAPLHVTWRIVRYAEAYPPARVALRVRTAADWGDLYSHLSHFEPDGEVWYLAEDRPPDDSLPRARLAHVVRWDGHRAEVEHDGTCDLVLRRTYYPGWTVRLNDGPPVPVLKADGGLQAVRIPGAGRTLVTLDYQPTALKSATTISIFALAAASLVVGFSFLRISL